MSEKARTMPILAMSERACTCKKHMQRVGTVPNYPSLQGRITIKRPQKLIRCSLPSATTDKHVKKTMHLCWNPALFGFINAAETSLGRYDLWNDFIRIWRECLIHQTVGQDRCQNQLGTLLHTRARNKQMKPKAKDTNIQHFVQVTFCDQRFQWCITQEPMPDCRKTPNIHFVHWCLPVPAFLLALLPSQAFDSLECGWCKKTWSVC